MSDDNFNLDNQDEDIKDDTGEDNKLNIWNNYIFSKRQIFLLDNKRHIGLEYDSNKLQWDMIFEREWIIIEERLNAGIGVELDMREQMGEEFFKRNKPLDDDIALMYDTMDEEQIDEDTKLRIYTFEDFNLLSNQGIFRDEVFIIDPQRKWKKKVKEALISHGYNDIERIEIKEGIYFVVSRKESE
tara:strand:+ start:816 stop:1373 length:558 start_codon:yes stop_codon:yes gene_type:complete